MHSTSEINAIVKKAKQQRAEYIGSKMHGKALSVALLGALSLVLVQLATGPSPDEAAPGPIVAEVVAPSR